ncbi:flagellar basal body protein, partial [Acinetobacter baumannii]|uniref:flagellar basal body protein n=1 Tax=Acinetobacter baumannii TaxID=470 RepID=UPI001F0A3C9F
MRGFQTKLDVIGNNIANVNTVGFKKSRVVFSDILSQTISGGNAANQNPDNGPIVGGTNPKQV